MVQHSQGTRHNANLVASGDGVPGGQWSYLIAERGHFVLKHVSRPPGAAAPHGSVLTLIVNASTGQVTDGGVSNRYPDLAKLGPVHTDLRRHPKHRGTTRRGRAAAGSGYGVDIQAVFTGAGNPLLVANFAPNGALAKPHFSICPPATPHRCQRANSPGRGLDPGPEPAGTRFVASASYRGHTYRSSVVWHGQVRPLSRPGLIGRRAMGSVVSPVAARWAGGWGSEFDQLGVEACRYKDGRQCRLLGGGELGCPDKSSRPRLGGWFTGWYLFAVDARLPKAGGCAGTAYFTNADLPVWKPGPGATIARSLAQGRISGPPRPTVQILPHAQLHGHTVRVVSLRCITKCTVGLYVDDHKHGFIHRFSLTGRARIGAPRRHLKAGLLAVYLHVDDGPLIRGHSRYG